MGTPSHERTRGYEKIKSGLNQYVEKGLGVIVEFHIYHNQLVVNGENAAVHEFLENTQLCTQIKNILNRPNSATYDFSSVIVGENSEEVPLFPNLFSKIRSKEWKGKKVTETATEYLRLIGFGRYGSKKYGCKNDEPRWWNTIDSAGDWSNFKGPSYHSIKLSTAIIEAILSDYNVDVSTVTPISNVETSNDLNEEEQDQV